MNAETTRQKLFAAIREDRFERISQIAAEYRDRAAEMQAEPLEDVLRPLNEALRYLRAVRAHQSARFQKLATDALYLKYERAG